MNCTFLNKMSFMFLNSSVSSGSIEYKAIKRNNYEISSLERN